MSLTPRDLLPVGTEVSVGTKRGTVTKAEMVGSSNNMGLICLHRIRFTHRLKRLHAGHTRWVALAKPIEQEVNYAFICDRRQMSFTTPQP